jgi:L-iditol 2-dehydrogenase
VFANLARVPEERLIAVPASVSAKAGGVLQVLGTVIHAQRAVSPFPGDVAVVIGLGVSGLLSVQLLVSRGVTVIGVTRSAWKRDLAKTFGAAAVAPPDEAAEAVGDLTGGRGVDLAVEAVGQEATLAQAIELARIGGEVLVFGTLTGGTAGLPYYQFYFKELTIRNPRAAMATDYERAVQLAAQGTLDLEPIVTHELPLSEAGQAFEAVRDSSSLKVVMIPE